MNLYTSTSPQCPSLGQTFPLTFRLVYPASHVEKTHYIHNQIDSLKTALSSFRLPLLGNWLLRPRLLEPSCLLCFPSVLPPIHPRVWSVLI